MTGSSDTLGNFPFLAIEIFGGGFFFADFIQIRVEFVCLFVFK